jgi:hypothetical protein
MWTGPAHKHLGPADRCAGGTHGESCPTLTHTFATYSNPCPSHAHYAPAAYR